MNSSMLITYVVHARKVCSVSTSVDSVQKASLITGHFNTFGIRVFDAQSYYFSVCSCLTYNHTEKNHKH